MAGIQSKGGKKNRKHGRNSTYCTRYKAEGRKLKNKQKRLLKALTFSQKKLVKFPDRIGLQRYVQSLTSQLNN